MSQLLHFLNLKRFAFNTYQCNKPPNSVSFVASLIRNGWDVQRQNAYIQFPKILTQLIDANR